MMINNTDLLSAESALKAHIRYAHAKAMQTADTIWGIRFDTDLDEYWMFQCNTGANCAWNSPRILPFGAEGSPTNVNNDHIKTSQTGIDIYPIRIGTDNQTQFTLVFNDMGVPFWVGNGNISFITPLENSNGINRLAQNATIQLADTSANILNIIVTGETGFVQ